MKFALLSLALLTLTGCNQTFPGDPVDTQNGCTLYPSGFIRCSGNQTVRPRDDTCKVNELRPVHDDHTEYSVKCR